MAEAQNLSSEFQPKKPAHHKPFGFSALRLCESFRNGLDHGLALG
jgi:hypothetical protein